MEEASEYIINLKIEHLPEGQYLATSDDLPGLLAQGRTVAETVEIAHDVAKKLIESYREHSELLPKSLKLIGDTVQFKLAVGY